MSGRIIVLHQGAIGDFVLALSVIQAVRAQQQRSADVYAAHEPAAHGGGETSHGPLKAACVTAIASSPAARLAAGRSAVDAWLSPEVLGLHRLFSDEESLNDQLRMHLSGADVVLSFLGDTSALVHRRLRECAAGQVVSIDPRPSRATLAGGRHITAQWAEAIRAAGLDIGEPSPPRIHLHARGDDHAAHTATLPAADDAAAPGHGRDLYECAQFRDTSQSEGPRGLKPAAHRGCGTAHGHIATHAATLPGGSRGMWRVVIHPGSGGRDKCWPVEQFAALADSLDDADIAWMLGPAEQETPGPIVEAVRRRVASTRESLISEPNLELAARHVAGADLYIGNDAGLTHLAAALGVPTVAIFTATDPRVWRPLGGHVTVVAPSPVSSGPRSGVTLEQVTASVCQFMQLGSAGTPAPLRHGRRAARSSTSTSLSASKRVSKQSASVWGMDGPDRQA